MGMGGVPPKVKSWLRLGCYG